MPHRFYFIAMETKDKKIISQILKEEPVIIRVGWLKCKIRPLTLSQIYEVGTLANDMKPIEVSKDGKINVLQQMVEHGNDARIMSEIFVACAYRKKILRKLFRRYIMKRLETGHLNELVKFLSQSFNVNFFLTSITFLIQTKRMTEPRTIPHGQSSEE